MQLQGSPAVAHSASWHPMHSISLANLELADPLHLQASQRTSTASRSASTTTCECGALGSVQGAHEDWAPCGLVLRLH